jgi:predicted DNA binding CopG/RHH family protein
MKNPMQKHTIPRFKTVQEEAEFWDTHSFADYWQELEPVEVRFVKPLARGLTVRFDKQTLADLQAEASKKGMGATTLVRMWVLESLNRLRRQPNL